MVTYGTNPGMGMPITGRVPAPETSRRAPTGAPSSTALEYMDLRPGQAILGQKVDVVFIGSCTNAPDQRPAQRGRRPARPACRRGMRVMVVPGSREVKRQAEQEGLDEVFRAAGAEWREAGCSMCIAMNGDQLRARPVRRSAPATATSKDARARAAGRSWPRPLTAAASALNGVDHATRGRCPASSRRSRSATR